MVCLGLLLLFTPALVHAGPVEDTVFSRCTASPDLTATAQFALEQQNTPPSFGEVLATHAQNHGFLAPNVRVWIAQGSNETVQSNLNEWMTRQQPDALSRCAIAHSTTPDRWAVIMVPRYVPVVGTTPHALVNTVARLQVQLLDTMHHAHIAVIDPSGLPTQIPLLPNGATTIRFTQQGLYILQLVASDTSGPRSFARWNTLVEAVDDRAPTTPTTSTPTENTESAENIQDERDILRLINRSRTAHGLTPLRQDPLLQSVAAERIMALAVTASVTHSLIPRDTPLVRLQQAHITANAIAENISRAATLRAAHDRLNLSPSHLANRLHPSLDSVAIAVHRADGHVYLLEMYALRPRLSD